jgi:hypothetical protein
MKIDVVFVSYCILTVQEIFGKFYRIKKIDITTNSVVYLFPTPHPIIIHVAR